MQVFTSNPDRGHPKEELCQILTSIRPNYASKRPKESYSPPLGSTNPSQKFSVPVGGPGGDFGGLGCPGGGFQGGSSGKPLRLRRKPPPGRPKPPPGPPKPPPGPRTGTENF